MGGEEFITHDGLRLSFSIERLAFVHKINRATGVCQFAFIVNLTYLVLGNQLSTELSGMLCSSPILTVCTSQIFLHAKRGDSFFCIFSNACYGALGDGLRLWNY